MVEQPADATHFAEFYGRTYFYRLTHYQHYNTVMECFQKLKIWHLWENGKWVSPGAGWSDRRLQPLQIV